MNKIRWYLMLSAGAVGLLSGGCGSSPSYTDKLNPEASSDLRGFEANFSHPAADYGICPFWFWNSEMTHEEIDLIVDDLAAHDYGSVMIHPREGMILEYLSDDYFEKVKYAADRAREKGMHVWLYDEDPYPSGAAGGRVQEAMPESYNQGQGLRLTKKTFVPADASSFYLCLKRNGEAFEDITSSVKDYKGQKGEYYLFSKLYNPPSVRHGGFPYVDLLVPGVTQKFLEITTPGYEKLFKDRFGKDVRGLFTDEPHYNHNGGGARWFPDLFERFEQDYGYSLKENLPSLYESVGNWRKVRHDYNELLQKTFTERFVRPMHDYCQANNLAFAGHYWEHNWPQINGAADVMGLYQWHQMPTIDLLAREYDDQDPQGQFGSVRIVKELASVANQMGRTRRMCEIFGASGWDFSLEDAKRVGDWAMALGINMHVLHSSCATMMGGRKSDYPPSFSYHNTIWDYFKPISTYLRRVSFALSSGREINDILVLEPTTSLWLYSSYSKDHTREAFEIGGDFQRFVTALSKKQVEYDLGSEDVFKNHSQVKGKRFTVGARDYSTVVIPPSMLNLEGETFALLKQFTQKGGTIVAFSRPEYVDGVLSEELKNFWAAGDKNIVFVDKLTPEVVENYLSSPDVRFENLEGGNRIFHQTRRMKDGKIIFIVNSAENKKPSSGSVSVEGAEIIGWNPFSGEKYIYPTQKEGNRLKVNFELYGAQSLLLYVSDKPSGGARFLKEASAVQKTVKASSPLEISRERDNMLVIDYLDLTLNGDKIRGIQTYPAADTVYKAHGFDKGNPWSFAIQFKNTVVERDTFSTGGFTADYRFRIEDNFDYSGLRAVVERPSLYRIFINGNPVEPIPGKWEMDIFFGVLDIGKYLKKGENTLSLSLSPFRVHAEIEPVYILGDFSVRADKKKGFVIENPAKEYALGSWKEQGAPFYPYGVTYSRKYDGLDPGKRYVVELGQWKGNVAEVLVNGQSAGALYSKPYRADVTSLVQPGENTVTVRILGSMQNVLGPFYGTRSDKGLVRPTNWRVAPPRQDVEAYTGLLDYGLMGDFRLLTQ